MGDIPTLKSKCHAAECPAEPIYLLVKRKPPYEGTTGRRQIGHVAVCPTCGTIQTTPIRYVGTGGFSDEAWDLMRRRHPRPPYYFQKDNTGAMVPE